MKKTKRIFCAFLAAVIMAVCFASCDEKEEIDLANITLTKEQLKDVQAKIEKTLDDADFSGAAYVKLNKNILYEKYVGTEDPETGKKIDKDTKYQVSAMTKNIAGAAILQLCDQGRLSMDDTLDMYFDSSGDRAYLKDVTIKKLVGIEVSFGAYYRNILYNKKKKNEIKKLIVKGGDVKGYITDFILDHGIEKHNNISHSNYYLLGLIIEKASGMDFKDYVQKNIYDKLQMKDSTFVNKRQIMSGYNVTKQLWRDETVNVYYNNYEFMFSSFGAVSTISDMLKFYDAVMTGKITKTSLIKKINEFYTNYGFGFRHDGHNLYSYSGTSLHTSYAYLNDETKEFVILNSNHVGNIKLNNTGKAVYNAVNSKINGMLLDKAANE